MILKIACCGFSSCVDQKGFLYVWGTGSFGEYLTPFCFNNIKSHMIDVNIGGLFGMALDENNQIWSWGNNSFGELGVSENELKNSAFPIMNNTMKNYEIK